MYVTKKVIFRKEVAPTKQELPHFHVDMYYGGNQDRMKDPTMKMGGCGALAAVDTLLLRDLKQGGPSRYTLEEYRKRAMEMKPYLRPRFGGISKLETYVEGFDAYLKDHHIEDLHMTTLPGTTPLQDAELQLKAQINAGQVVPCLMLNTKQTDLKFYEWHWFLLNGYEDTPEGLLVKATTYGSYRWIAFEKLWNTGIERKGGLILYAPEPERRTSP